MPQGHPVLFQAGNSDDGRAFAAANADAIFSLPRNKESAFAYRADLRERTAAAGRDPDRSEEHTSELQSLMRISYAVFCLKKKKNTIQHTHPYTYPQYVYYKT